MERWVTESARCLFEILHGAAFLAGDKNRALPLCHLFKWAVGWKTHYRNICHSRACLLNGLLLLRFFKSRQAWLLCAEWISGAVIWLFSWLLVFDLFDEWDVEIIACLTWNMQIAKLLLFFTSRLLGCGLNQLQRDWKKVCFCFGVLHMM